MRMDQDQGQMNRYYALLSQREFEGKVLHFYTDSVGLVTIGVGDLVDQRGATSAEGQAVCTRWLDERAFVSFQRGNGTTAPRAEILADWHAVKGGAQATLRISELVCRQIFRFKVGRFVDGMLGTRPYADRLPSLIQRALVDVRFNPGGVNPFNTAEPEPPNTGAKRQMWRRLELASGAGAGDGVGEAATRVEHLSSALQLFGDIWSRVDVPRLRRRHLQHRCAWFAAGIRESMSAQERADPLNRLLAIPGGADPFARL